MSSGANSMITVIWIDWYAYHFARFRGLEAHPALSGRVSGVELVGKSGVHQGLIFREEKPSELPVFTLQPTSSWHETSQFGLATMLWRRLTELNPQAVLVPGYYTLPAIAAALWARRHGRRSLLMTESGEQDHSRSFWKEWLKRKLVHALFDSAISGGRAHATYLAKLGFASERIAQFYDVVDNRFFWHRADVLRRTSSSAENQLPRRYFLYVGRFAPEKNLLSLIRAFSKYRAEGGNWSLVLAGGGPLHAELVRECAVLGIAGHVNFTGMKRTLELPTQYAFASCFVLPSIREPWGLVVNEAMASVLPILVSNRCGCAPDLVEDGSNGFLFDPSNEADLTQQLLRMSRLSSQRREEMGQRSREIVSQYSPESFANEVARSIGQQSPKATVAA
jgi:1,2-diacylglycerol 3-alpha-glucosyltransferase